MLFPIILFSAICAVMIFLGFRPATPRSYRGQTTK